MLNKWDDRFLELANHVAQWSKDPSTRVGAVLVNDLKQVISLAYNGFSRGVSDAPEDYENRELKYKQVVHAEINAVLNANTSTKGTTLYCTFFPCPQCTAMLIQAGIKRVVSQVNPSDKRWREDQKISQKMLIEADITYQVKGN